MAGIPGQPSPKPSALPKGPQGATDFSALDAMQSEAPSGDFSALDSMGAGSPAPSGGDAPQTADFPGAGFVQGGLDALPAIGGIVGGAAGFGAAGPPGMVGGAAAGGVAGESLRQTLQDKIFGAKPDRAQFYGDLAKSGATEGVGSMLGGSLTAAGEKFVASKFGKAAGQFLSEAEGPINVVKKIVSDAKDKLEAPALNLLNSKTTAMNTEAAGDTAKQLLKDNIQRRYGPFVQAYSDLEQVHRAMPHTDQANYKLFNSTMDWARNELGGDEYRVVKKFAQDLNGTQNGAQFDSVLRSIADAKNTAFQNGSVKQGQVLQQLYDRSHDAMEAQVGAIAERVAAGKATPQEMQMIQQIAAQRGAPPEEGVKYAKQLASDFLKGRDKVKADYSGFRSFLSDVGEQTKVKAEGRGPMTFLTNLDDVPSEKLIERMFDPKNAAALRRMQSETPEVFDTVVKSKMNQVIQQASPDGQLDLGAVRRVLGKMPESTRNMLMTGDEMKLLHATVDNPRAARLANLSRASELTVLKLMADVSELTRTTGIAAGKGTGAMLKQPAAQTAVGAPMASPLLNAFGPSQGQGQQ